MTTPTNERDALIEYAIQPELIGKLLGLKAMIKSTEGYESSCIDEAIAQLQAAREHAELKDYVKHLESMLDTASNKIEALKQAARNQSNNVPVAPYAYEVTYANKTCCLVYEEAELDPDNVEVWGDYVMKPLYTSPQQSNALEMAALTEALKWALSYIDVSDWEEDIHMSAACGKYAWAHHVLRKAQSAQPESDGK